MGLSRTVSEIHGDLGRKSKQISPPRVFCAPAEGVPLGIGYRCWGSKNYNDGAIYIPGWERTFTISLAVSLHAPT